MNNLINNSIKNRFFSSSFVISFTSFIVLFLANFFFFFSFSIAHSVLPPEVVEFIQSKENVTDEEIEEFFQETYGYSIDEFWKNNPSPVDQLMQPSEEFIQMQLKNPENIKNLSPDVQEIINNAAKKVLANDENFQNMSPSSQENFLKQAMRLKFEKSPMTPIENIKKFIPIGISHILSGYDHILFILSILLLGLTFRKLLILISVFTISHSLTLILAGMGIITLSSQIVEPIIALSIIYTAFIGIFKTQFPKLNIFRNHIITIFLFGLFHGLGFAGSFSDLNISSENFLIPLFSLNIGVEIGQLIIIAFAFPILWVIFQQRGGKIILNIFASLIIFISSLWFIERVFNLEILPF